MSNMSNNSEYTREYIDNVDEHFRVLEMKLLMPAREKTLTFQAVEEVFQRFGEMDSMRDYLVDNVQGLSTDWEEMEEQIEEYKAVKKALLKLKVQLDTFYQCIPEAEDGIANTDRDEYEKWVDTLDQLAEGEVPEELKNKVKSQQKKSKK